MPSTLPEVRAVLVHHAENNLERLPYLSNLPLCMLQTLDAAVEVSDQVLPAHSFVLMSSSNVLREVLLTQSNLFHTQKVLQVPLEGDTSEDVCLALDCMYKQCRPRVQESHEAAGSASHKTALSLMHFGHKYDAHVLFSYAESSLQHAACDHMILDYNKKADICSRVRRYRTYTEAVKMPEDVMITMIDITNAAEEFEMVILDRCIYWLAMNYKACQAHEQVWHGLSKSNMHRVSHHNIRMHPELCCVLTNC